MLLNYHRIDENNSGDTYSSPLYYFEFDTPSLELEIGPCDEPMRLDADVIVGGGGLLARKTFAKRLRYLCENNKGKLISWGIGHNDYTKAVNRHIRYRGLGKISRIARTRLAGLGLTGTPFEGPIDYSGIKDIMDSFHMHGIRDYGCGYDWVPCASCMHPALDRHRATEPEHEVVVYDHVGRKRLEIEDLPRMGNGSGDLNGALAFLASGETVITSTYHGAYWGLMLGRKVIVVPWATKFLGFRHPVTLCHELVDLVGCLKRVQAFPEALEECRAANVAFAHRVADYLGVSVRLKPRVGEASGHGQLV